jgi:hypothetical protein
VDRKSGTYHSKFNVPTWCGAMRISTAFSAHIEAVLKESDLGQVAGIVFDEEL